MKISAKIKFYLTLSVAILVFGGLSLLFIFLSIGVNSSEFSLQSLRAQIFSNEHEREQARIFRSLLKEHSGELQRTKMFFLTEGGLVEFVELLEALARGTKNSILLGIGAFSVPETDISLTIDGSGQSIAKFLSLLELLPYDISVQQIGLQQVSADGQTARLFTTIKIKTAN